ncbi:hypothetical protein KIN20_006363 [Parelaphostrongylus tenuis]|uniref:Uncharacterized protein n=1 Tax=Parelaphostrongylus tenuis TaxID=148309 RepID=A0AAD5MMV5_PARTN|nr:hypothetical protein KIN20_006363 [Parelaphostrongylus tenuis]
MWQSVVDRAFQMLASGPFGNALFFSARATVGGNWSLGYVIICEIRCISPPSSCLDL